MARYPVSEREAVCRALSGGPTLMESLLRTAESVTSGEPLWLCYTRDLFKFLRFGIDIIYLVMGYIDVFVKRDPLLSI